MPDGKIEGPGRKLSVVALTEAANSERRKAVNFMVEDKSFIRKSGRPWCDHVVTVGVLSAARCDTVTDSSGINWDQLAYWVTISSALARRRSHGLDILWSQGTHSGTGKQEQTTFKGKVIYKTLYQTQLQFPITLITRPYLVEQYLFLFKVPDTYLISSSNNAFPPVSLPIMAALEFDYVIIGAGVCLHSICYSPIAHNDYLLDCRSHSCCTSDWRPYYICCRIGSRPTQLRRPENHYTWSIYSGIHRSAGMHFPSSRSFDSNSLILVRLVRLYNLTSAWKILKRPVEGLLQLSHKSTRMI